MKKQAKYILRIVNIKTKENKIYNHIKSPVLFESYDQAEQHAESMINNALSSYFWFRRLKVERAKVGHLVRGVYLNEIKKWYLVELKAKPKNIGLRIENTDGTPHLFITKAEGQRRAEQIILDNPVFKHGYYIKIRNATPSEINENKEHNSYLFRGDWDL